MVSIQAVISALSIVISIIAIVFEVTNLIEIYSNRRK